MMKKLKNNKLILMTTFLLFALISCKKDSIDANNLVDQIAISLSAYSTVPSSDASFILSNKQLVFDKTQSNGFPAVLSSTSGNEVDAAAKIDYNPRLLQVYDSLYHTKSPILPEGLFLISGGGKINVRAGKIQSDDSIKVQINDLTKIGTGVNNFVIPITMTSSSSQLKSKIMFIRYKITVANITLPGFGVSTINGAKFYNLNMPSTIATASGPYVQMMLDKPLAIVSTVKIEVISTPEFAAAYSTFSGVGYLPFPAGAYSISLPAAEFNANGFSPPAAKSIRILCTGTLFNKGGKYLMAVRIKTANPTVLPIEELIKSPELIYFALTII
jgi:hypothetical protein